VSLLGTIIGASDQEHIAVFLESGTQSILRLRVGEAHQGWVLRLIKAREVTLVKDREQAVVLTLPPPGDVPPPGMLGRMPGVPPGMLPGGLPGVATGTIPVPAVPPPPRRRQGG
jgi:general secretion pathway protein N